MTPRTPSGPKPTGLKLPSSKKAAPKNRLTEISPARKAAFKILLAIQNSHAHSDDLLRGHSVTALVTSDRHLATALVLGVLRWQIQLDRQIQTLLTRPDAKLDPEILVALRLGALQILHMDRIPARAAIDESVELAKQAGHRFASAMVNAVLRKLASAPRLDSAKVAPGDLAAAHAHPAWMVERWVSFFGLEEAQNICRYGQAQPSITIRLCTAFAQDELDQAGVTLEAGQLLASARTVTAGDISGSEAYRSGHVRIQDEGSQLVAEIAAIQLGSQQGCILDACAAPGGKTLILAERAPEAHILACEASAPRLEQLRVRLAAHADRVECRLADSTQLPESAVFDVVLADVPCSGTGTLGRNPEIRHRLRREDLSRQAARQRSILAAALRAVRPGGRVVYSTCSLEPEENEQVVAAVLAGDSDARAISVLPTIDALYNASILDAAAAERLVKCVTPEGTLRLLPGRSRSDGFFIAILERQ